MNTPISDLMTTEVLVVEPKDTLARARNLMLRHRISRLPVMEGERMSGIIAKKDLIRFRMKEMLRFRDLEDIEIIERHMTKNPVVVSPNLTVRDAAEIFLSRNIGGAPVLSGSELVGIVCRYDLVGYLAENPPSNLSVEDAMTRDLITIEKNESIRKALKLMLENGVDRLLVLDGGSLVGVITETDILFAEWIRRNLEVVERELLFVRKPDKDSRPMYRDIHYVQSPLVEELMSEDPITIEPSTDLAEAARIMLDKDIGCLPIVREDELLGLVTKTDVLRAYLKRSGGE